jgi:hypothetical protein
MVGFFCYLCGDKLKKSNCTKDRASFLMHKKESQASLAARNALSLFAFGV